ncbi:MAG: hypothetical protein E7A62_04355 [Actinomycetaceae bacterium]|nr:hypothetical protein [Actinomycetaceae bacterium]MDU0970218.1 hypothetical protein [Actinomycetaceae bacterium]
MNETTRELDEDERGELERLRKEHEELLKDNEFLRKAAAYFEDKRGSQPPSK